jgi:hypothetical protein
MTPHCGEADPKQGVERLKDAGNQRSSQLHDCLARMTVPVPQSLCRQAGLDALDQDITLSSLLTRLIRVELETQ